MYQLRHEFALFLFVKSNFCNWQNIEQRVHLHSQCSKYKNNGAIKKFWKNKRHHSKNLKKVSKAKLFVMPKQIFFLIINSLTVPHPLKRNRNRLTGLHYFKALLVKLYFFGGILRHCGTYTFTRSALK